MVSLETPKDPPSSYNQRRIRLFRCNSLTAGDSGASDRLYRALIFSTQFGDSSELDKILGDVKVSFDEKRFIDLVEEALTGLGAYSFKGYPFIHEERGRLHLFDENYHTSFETGWNANGSKDSWIPQTYEKGQNWRVFVRQVGLGLKDRHRNISDSLVPLTTQTIQLLSSNPEHFPYVHRFEMPESRLQTGVFYPNVWKFESSPEFF